jgi:AcrR family transcriptional regulator
MAGGAAAESGGAAAVDGGAAAVDGGAAAVEGGAAVQGGAAAVDGGAAAVDGGAAAVHGEAAAVHGGAAARGGRRRVRLSAGERRELILVAATEVFGETGYRAAKVSDIAARVGVTEPVVFQNFGSKAALYTAVLERAAADMRAGLHELAPRFASVTELLAHVASPEHVHGHHPGSPGVLYADAATLATTEPELAAAAAGLIRAIADHLAGLLRMGQDRGDIRAGLDPEAAAWLFLSLLAARGFRAAAMPEQGQEQLERSVSELAVAALAG